MTLARTAPTAASLSRTLRARSTVDPTITDTVKFTSV